MYAAGWEPDLTHVYPWNWIYSHPNVKYRDNRLVPTVLLTKNNVLKACEILLNEV